MSVATFPSQNEILAARNAPAQYCTIDFFRGFAAFLVVASHLRNLFFVDFRDIPNPSLFTKAFYFLTAQGSSAVILFFVLSGFLVGGSLLKQAPMASWSWTDYTVKRLTRLWIVLLPALFLTYFWDTLGQILFGEAMIYAGDQLGGNTISFSVAGRSDFWTYLANAFFLQGIFCEAAGSNGPLWSLSFEFGYYLFFPCFIRALFAENKKERFASGCLSFVIAILLYRHQRLIGFAFWLLGVGLAQALCKKQSKGKQKPGSWFQKGSSFFAGFSYSLYLTHMPVLVFLRAALLRKERWLPGAESFLVAALILGMVFFYAYWVSMWTEKHTHKMRAGLIRFCLCSETS